LKSVVNIIIILKVVFRAFFYYFGDVKLH